MHTRHRQGTYATSAGLCPMLWDTVQILTAPPGRRSLDDANYWFVSWTPSEKSHINDAWDGEFLERTFLKQNYIKIWLPPTCVVELCRICIICCHHGDRRNKQEARVPEFLPAPWRRCLTHGRDVVSYCYLRLCNLCRSPWLTSSGVRCDVCSVVYLLLSGSKGALFVSALHNQ